MDFPVSLASTFIERILTQKVSALSSFCRAYRPCVLSQCGWFSQVCVVLPLDSTFSRLFILAVVTWPLWSLLTLAIFQSSSGITNASDLNLTLLEMDTLFRLYDLIIKLQNRNIYILFLFKKALVFIGFLQNLYTLPNIRFSKLWTVQGSRLAISSVFLFFNSK